MDEDGSNVTAIAPMSINSAHHPVPLRDGHLTFSSYESQGLRDRRLLRHLGDLPRRPQLVADHQSDLTRIDRTFATTTSLIFADGFESAEVTGWAAVTP